MCPPAAAMAGRGGRHRTTRGAPRPTRTGRAGRRFPASRHAGRFLTRHDDGATINMPLFDLSSPDYHDGRRAGCDEPPEAFARVVGGEGEVEAAADLDEA